MLNTLIPVIGTILVGLAASNADKFPDGKFDQCEPRTVKAQGGNYVYDSVEHCIPKKADRAES